MKIISRIMATSLAISLISPKPAAAVPIVIAPIACAKVCVLLGTAVVGGVSSYVWHYRQAKKKYFADEKGNVRKILVDPEDPEGSMRIPENGAFYAKGKKEADARCKSRGYEGVVEKNDVTSGRGKYYVCR